MPALSKTKVKLFSSLHFKKFRLKEGRFLVEGRKMVAEALASDWEVENVVVNEGYEGEIDIAEEQLLVAAPADFKRISQQTSPEGVLAVLRMNPAFYARTDSLAKVPTGPTFLLDDLRDPGNLGTILRICDWFGFRSVICSGGTVDVLNAKVLRSSMGSVFRVPVTYVLDFEGFVRTHAPHISVADMDGADIADVRLSARPMLLLGNEANGVSPALRGIPELQPVAIAGQGGAESLNAAVAAGILAWKYRNDS